MSDADLSSCRTKVARAKQKLDALQAQVGPFLDSRPYRVEVEQPPGKFIATVRIDRPPDPDWAVDAGEVANDVRSALDYLVFQLAIDNGANPRQDRTQFPIFLDDTEYRKGGRRSHRERMLAGVSTRHRRDIDNLQPYQRGRQAAPDDPLALLRSISDRDKHREPHVTLSVMGTMTVKFPYTPEAGRPFFRVHFPTPKPLKDGERIADWDSPESVPGIEVGIEPIGRDPDFNVAFEGDSDRASSPWTTSTGSSSTSR